jgi:hypothetical protein
MTSARAELADLPARVDTLKDSGYQDTLEISPWSQSSHFPHPLGDFF